MDNAPLDLPSSILT